MEIDKVVRERELGRLSYLGREDSMREAVELEGEHWLSVLNRKVL